MKIIPKFNINRDFKNCESGSIVAAKNIVVNETGEYIMPEPPFKTKFSLSEEDNVHIVGVIPTPTELYIFCDNNKIYQSQENKYIALDNCNWKYIPDTKFIGTYTYMSDGKICLVVSQYTDKEGDDVDYSKYPLQSWIVDNNDVSNYNICPDIPAFKSSYKINEQGNLVAGVYTFFIRFKISNHDYTHWFQLTGDINIGSKIEHEIINHNYKIQNTIQQANTVMFDKFNVNKIGHTNKSIILSINTSDPDVNYKDYQIAAIVKVEESVVGRIFIDTDNLTENNNTFNIATNDFIQEVSIDELTKNPIQYFNVKALCNYNNRLYIGNYHEYKIAKGTISATAELGYYNDNFVQDEYDKNTNSRDYDYAILNINFQINSSSIKNIKKEVKIVKVDEANGGAFAGQYKVCDPNSEDTQSEVNAFWEYVADNLYIQNQVNGAYEPLSRINTDLYGEPIYDEDGRLKTQNYIRTTYSMYIGETYQDSMSPIHMSCWSNRELNKDNDIFVKLLTGNGEDECLPTTHTSLYGRDGGSFSGSVINYMTIDEVQNNIDKSKPSKEWTNIYISNTGRITLFDSRFGSDYHVFMLDGIDNSNKLTTPTIYEIPAKNKSESNDCVKQAKKIELLSQGYNGGWAITSLNILYNVQSYQINRPFDKTQDNKNYYKYTIKNNLGNYYITSKFTDKDLWVDRFATEINHHLDNAIIYGNAKKVLTRKASSSPSAPSASNSISSNRTLIPKQKYNTYIHYIRKDGSHTLGFKIDNNFDELNIEGAYLNGVSVKVNDIPKEYKGYFITYEKPIKSVEWLIKSKYQDKIVTTNSDMIYNDHLIYTENPKIEKFVYNKLGQNYAETNESSTNFVDDFKIVYGTLKTQDYNAVKYKTLYRLTPNIYEAGKSYNSNEYCPGYYNKEKSIIFDKPVLFASDSETVCNMDDTEVNYTVSMVQDYVYSDIPIDQFVVKKDFETRAMTFTKNGSSDYLGSYTNNILSPIHLKDFLRMPACYIAPPSKSYTNYVEDNYVDYFPQTVRRSDQISDESRVNSFRLFSTDEYKNIFENKGEIVNIFGSGNTLVVHCKYGMYKFDSTNNLTATATTKKVDIFYNGYEDCFPDQVGYGGLDDIDECILCKGGYIWFDKKNRTILKMNEKITTLSDDLDVFLKKFPIINTVRFAYTQDKRILICIYFSDANNSSSSITLSFNLNTNTLISAHDYKFNKSYCTYNETYFPFKANTSLSVLLDKNILDNNASDKDIDVSDDAIFPGYGSNTSYVEIIYSDNYPLVKALDSINYSLYQTNHSKEFPLFEESDSSKNNEYSGNGLVLYSDSCYSGLLDIHVDSEDLNKLNKYKFPYYNKGQWELNYFRNNNPSDEFELKEGYTIVPVYKNNNSNLTFVNKQINLEEYKRKLYGDKSPIDTTEPRLIYGKYIVARFVFTNADYKFEDVSFNVSLY